MKNITSKLTCYEMGTQTTSSKSQIVCHKDIFRNKLVINVCSEHVLSSIHVWSMEHFSDSTTLYHVVIRLLLGFSLKQGLEHVSFGQNYSWVLSEYLIFRKWIQIWLGTCHHQRHDDLMKTSRTVSCCCSRFLHPCMIAHYASLLFTRYNISCIQSRFQNITGKFWFVYDSPLKSECLDAAEGRNLKPTVNLFSIFFTFWWTRFTALNALQKSEVISNKY